MTAPDLDRLIERELQIADGETMLGWDGDARDRRKVVAALVQLRDSEALARGKIAEQMIEIERLKANQRCSAIEQDEVGYPCVFRAEAEARIAALEAERADLIMDALIDGAMRLLRYHIDAAKEKP